MTKMQWFHLIASTEVATFCGSVLAFVTSPMAQRVSGTGDKLRSIAGLLFNCWLLENVALLTWGMVAFVWSVN
ncbi:MAG TPA: hypothetical protein VFR24_27715 [Candidatus Angelobacter sp.]|nr:hypothetical protein [Candidatus Angelobacter sp.]